MSKAPIICRIERGHFVPIDGWGAEQIAGLPTDREYSLTYTQAKTSKNLRPWYWAGLGLLVENFADEDRFKWPSSRKVHNMLMEAQGFTYKLWRVDNTYRIEIDSVSYEKMTDEEFATMFETSRAIVVGLFGYDPWQRWMDERTGGR